MRLRPGTCRGEGGYGEPRYRGRGDQGDRSSVQQHAVTQRSVEVPARDEGDGRRRADQATDADRRAEEAGTRPAGVEQLEGEHDDDDVEDAEHEELRAEEADDDARAPVPPHQLEARERLPDQACPVGRRCGRRRTDADASDQNPRHDEQPRHGGVHGARPRHRHDPARERRPEHDGGVLDRAVGHVGGCELVRGAGERRQQRGVHRPDEGDPGGRDRGERVDGGRRCVEEQRDGGGADRRHLDAVRDEEHGLPAVAIAEDGRERRERRGRDELDRRDETDSAGAALPVGVDGDGDVHRPLGHVEADEGELDAPEIGDPQRLAADTRGRPELRDSRPGLSREGRPVRRHAARAT